MFILFPVIFATDGNDGNGLKLRLIFSSFDAISTKITKKRIVGRAF